MIERMRLNRHKPFVFWYGAIAQLGERVLCKHEVVGSIPSASTRGLKVTTSLLPCSQCAFIGMHLLNVRETSLRMQGVLTRTLHAGFLTS